MWLMEKYPHGLGYAFSKNIQFRVGVGNIVKFRTDW